MVLRTKIKKLILSWARVKVKAIWGPSDAISPLCPHWPSDCRCSSGAQELG